MRSVIQGWIGLTLLCWGVSPSWCQQCKIQGRAPDFTGEEVRLLTYRDYITQTKTVLGKGVVRAEDSSFHLTAAIGTTIKAWIQIGNIEAPIYLAPQTDYTVYFPQPKNRPASFQSQLTDMVFFGLDSTDINYRILQYHQWFDTFVAYHERAIAGGGFLAYLDTFKTYAAQAYRSVDDPYFITYVRYNIAQMQQTFTKGIDQTHFTLFRNDIQPHPVYYENDQYMPFLIRFYSRNRASYTATMTAEINRAIHYASPNRLMDVLKQDPFLRRTEIREIVMIDQLGKRYRRYPHQREPILIMLDSLSHHAKYRGNATIAKNMQHRLTHLTPGFPAPEIELTSPAVPLRKWEDYRGKFVYLNFFETWSEQATTDMLLIKNLKEKYGAYIHFLSVCTDRREEDYQTYMEGHSELDWDIFYAGHNHPIKASYGVKVTPSYFLIDPSGLLQLSPAPSPTPDGTYKSIENAFLSIKKAQASNAYRGTGK